jgi:hypothetical protein
MTVSIATNKNIYDGDGATSQWPFTFPVLDEGDIEVHVTDADLVETTIDPSLYDVDIANARVTYPLTGDPLPDDGTTITLIRIVALTQLTDWQNQGSFNAETLEAALDKITMEIQQVSEAISRAVKYPIDTTPTVTDTETFISMIAAIADAAITAATEASDSEDTAALWATLTGAYVEATSLSAKEWALGTYKRGVAAYGSAKDWANYTAGTVDNAEYSAKYYAEAAAASAASIASPLPIASGGTNSTTALSNNRMMKSSSDKIVEAAAITASRALISDANGIVTHSTVTDAELAYLSGVTSAIQTQLNAKAAVAGQQFTGSISFDNCATHGVVGTTTNNDAAAGNVGECVESIYSGDDNLASTGVFQNATSISLTAGDWEVRGSLVYRIADATGVTEADTAISIYSANTKTDHVVGKNEVRGFGPTASNITNSVLPFRLSLSATTTVYLKGSCGYSGGHPKLNSGCIAARRIR